MEHFNQIVSKIHKEYFDKESNFDDSSTESVEDVRTEEQGTVTEVPEVQSTVQNRIIEQVEQLDEPLPTDTINQVDLPVEKPSRQKESFRCCGLFGKSAKIQPID